MIVKQPDERFPTAPEGSFAAVCVDEIDLGKQQSNWNGETRERVMCRLVWQIDEEDADGNLFLVKQDYTASLDEKAKLRKTLQSWRGRQFTPTELSGFDLENVVGSGCMLTIVHNQGSRGGTFANVEVVTKLPKGMVAPKPRGYIRVKDRKTIAPQTSERSTRPAQKAAPEEEPPAFDDFNPTDDNIPF
jgi:hypothetical protein